MKSLTHILQLMNRIGESACLDVYIASRKQAVQSVMQVVATSVVVTAPTGAHSERQIFQCAPAAIVALAASNGSAQAAYVSMLACLAPPPHHQELN